MSGMANLVGNGTVVDVRELSFQNVVDQILKPNGVKVGGFPDELFECLTDDEQSEYLCNICYMVLNEPQQCENKHLFCETCIFAWSLTYGENSQRCPVCRCEQKTYEANTDVRRKLWDKVIRCPEEKCEFKGAMRAFLMHSHGKLRFSNKHVDLDTLRPARPEGARLLVLPNIQIQGSTRLERVTSLRDQIHQGRMMIHQMMLLLHLEMQLRQQAMVSYSQTTDPVVRLQRLDEVMALNEQLNEVGGVLSTLLNSPINNLIEANRTNQNVGARSSPPAGLAAAHRPPETLAGLLRHHSGLSDSSSSDSDDSDSFERFRRSVREGQIDLGTAVTRQQSSSTTANRNSVQASTARTPARSGSNAHTDDGDIPDIPTGRHLSDLSQVGVPVTNIHPRVLLGTGATAGTRSEQNSTVEESTHALNGITADSLNNDVATAGNTVALPSINQTRNSVPNSLVRTNATAGNSPSTPRINTPAAPASTSTASRRYEPRPPPPNTSASGATSGSGTAATSGTAPSSGAVSASGTVPRLASARTRTIVPSLPHAAAGAAPVQSATQRPLSRTRLTYETSVNSGNDSAVTPRQSAISAAVATSAGSGTAERSGNRSAATAAHAVAVAGPARSSGPTIEPMLSEAAAGTSNSSSSSNSVSGRRNATHGATQRATGNQTASNAAARALRYAPRIQSRDASNDAAAAAAPAARRNAPRPINARRTSNSSTHSNPTAASTAAAAAATTGAAPKRTGLNRPRDISNRLANASYRRNATGASTSASTTAAENHDNRSVLSRNTDTGSPSLAARQTAARRRTTGSHAMTSRDVIDTSVPMRARRRSEIKEQLGKSPR